MKKLMPLFILLAFASFSNSYCVEQVASEPTLALPVTVHYDDKYVGKSVLPVSLSETILLNTRALELKVSYFLKNERDTHNFTVPIYADHQQNIVNARADIVIGNVVHNRARQVHPQILTQDLCIILSTETPEMRRNGTILLETDLPKEILQAVLAKQATLVIETTICARHSSRMLHEYTVEIAADKLHKMAPHNRERLQLMALVCNQGHAPAAGLISLTEDRDFKVSDILVKALSKRDADLMTRAIEAGALDYISSQRLESACRDMIDSINDLDGSQRLKSANILLTMLSGIAVGGSGYAILQSAFTRTQKAFLALACLGGIETIHWLSYKGCEQTIKAKIKLEKSFLRAFISSGILKHEKHPTVGVRLRKTLVAKYSKKNSDA